MHLPFLPADRASPPWFVASFDSATGLVRALANRLHGQPFAGAGTKLTSELAASVIDLLPWWLQRRIYVAASAAGAVDPTRLGAVEAEAYCRWVTGLYPARQYPAMFIGSSNGAAMFLASAMGVPWLPQTFLLPVKTPKSSPDDPQRRMEWAQRPAAELLGNHPELQLHHMMDPLQDRPMLETTAYFRLKLLGLGAAYRAFIARHLAPGGTLYLVECAKSWPVTRVAARHYFQFGGLGGLSPASYRTPNAEVASFLRGARAAVTQWAAPEATETQVEAEWGFAQPLGTAVADFAAEQGYQLARIRFGEPEALSPVVADIYAEWYRARGLDQRILLGQMFFLTAPLRTLAMGAVPFWLAFNAQPSADCLRDYLAQRAPFAKLYLMLFSNGVAGPGFATEATWRQLLAQATAEGKLVGSRAGKYPYDFGVYARYERDLRRHTTHPQPVAEVAAYAAAAGHRMFA